MARYHRPAAMVAASMSGADVRDLLAFCGGYSVEVDNGYSAADMATFKAFGMKPPSKGAGAQMEH